MLTERKIRDAKPGPKAVILWDGQLRGFGVKVQPGGSKAYVLSYRTGGRKRQVTLARVGELSLKAARERAGSELVAIRDGTTDPLERREEARSAPTVADAVERFLGSYSEGRIERGRMSPRTLRDYASQCRSTILPALGRLRVVDVETHHVERMVEPLRPVMRNRVLAVTSRIFTLCEHWGLRPQRTNPVRGIERAIETARKRVLSAEEFAALAKALDARADENPAPVAAIRVAALTGLRISEVLAIEWANINMETGALHMPETKTGARDHDMPAPALAIIADRPRVNGCPYVFSTDGRSAVGYKHVRTVFKAVCEAAGLEGVNLHDLRRSVATRAAMAGLTSLQLRDLLGWASLSMPARYVELAGETARQHRQAIGDEIAGLMAAEPTKIIAFPERK